MKHLSLRMQPLAGQYASLFSRNCCHHGFHAEMPTRVAVYVGNLTGRKLSSRGQHLTPMHAKWIRWHIRQKCELPDIALKQAKEHGTTKLEIACNRSADRAAKEAAWANIAIDHRADPGSKLQPLSDSNG